MASAGTYIAVLVVYDPGVKQLCVDDEQIAVRITTCRSHSLSEIINA